MQRHLLITGGAGLIGRALIAHFRASDWRITGLTRDANKAQMIEPEVQWVETLREVSAPAQLIINLAGASVGEARWSARRKQVLMSSRVETTSAVREYCEAVGAPQKLVNASAVGYYGLQGSMPLDESGEPNKDCFSHALCDAWESSAQAFETLGIAVYRLRLGVVLSNDAPAWQKMSAPAHIGLATVAGHGKQMFSWVHLEDVVRAVDFVVNHEVDSGAINLTAPEPVSARGLAETMVKTGYARVIAKVPAGLLRLAMGQMAEELILGGQAVLPQKLTEHGFTFLYPSLSSALTQLRAAKQ